MNTGVLTQKTFTPDFLTKKAVANDGTVPQYYVEDSHPAIIAPEQFALVQDIFAERARDPKHSGATIFSGKIRCGCCGGWYGSKVWHSNDKYRRVIWQCNHKFKDKTRCKTPHLTEDEIKAAFVRMVNKLYEDTETGAETIIMMHGWTSNHEIYDQPVSVLKDKARCIIYDHRGHGGSREANHESPNLETLASDLHEIITGLSLSDVTLLGWSMGAAVAMNYVRMYGCSALKQLVLCDMTPKQLNDEEWKLGLYQGAGAHTREEWLDIGSLKPGLLLGLDLITSHFA